MKNILVIDGAENCVFDVFAATEEEFSLIFAPDTDIAFSEDIYIHGNVAAVDNAMQRMWTRRIKKCDAVGIHGTLFINLPERKALYPTMRDEEAINPDGTRLR